MQTIKLNNLESLPFSDFSKCKSIDSYIRSLTPSFKKIFKYIYTYKNAAFIKLKRETIALATNCSIKTVSRATTKFMEDGYINKMQANSYAPNNFFINPIESLSKPVNFKSHVCNVRFEEKAKNKIDNNSIVKKNLNTSVSHTNHNSNYKFSIKYKPNIINARVDGLLSKVLDLRIERYKIGVTMLKETQKAWISKNKNRITIKTLLEREDVRQKLITPTMEKLINLVGLDSRESVKLVAFPDEVLEFALGRALADLKRKSGIIIINKKSWLYGLLNSRCKELSIRPDWNWYKVICDIGGEEAFQSIPSVPDKLEYDKNKYVKAKDNSGKMQLIPRQYRIFEKTAEDDIETKISYLVSEKMSWEEKILNPDKYFTNSFAAEFAMKMAKSSIKNIELKLAELQRGLH